jgi:1,4-dihydroxy-2-naphthoyl-CoA synthase
MPQEDVLYEVDGAVAIVTLNRPKYRNAQSWMLLDALDRALDRAMAEEEVKVVLVRGAGEHFSSTRTSASTTSTTRSSGATSRSPRSPWCGATASSAAG